MSYNAWIDNYGLFEVDSLIISTAKISNQSVKQMSCVSFLSDEVSVVNRSHAMSLWGKHP